MNQQTAQFLKDDLEQNICYITFALPDVELDPTDTDVGHLVSTPHTTKSVNTSWCQVPELEDTNQQDDLIVAWDIISNKRVEFKIHDVLDWSMCTKPSEDDKGITRAPDRSHDWDASMTKLEDHMNKLNEYEGAHDIDKLKTIRFRRDCDDVSWNLLELFDYECACVNDLKNADETLMTKLRQKYMNTIRRYREKAFEELDQLEQEARENGDSEEDLQDIDTIKQMFRDIPQDTDLTQYKTSHELIQFWPSLLLPSPVTSPDSLKPHATFEQHVEDIVKKIGNDDVNDLKQLIQQIESQDITVEKRLENKKAIGEEIGYVPMEQTQQQAQQEVDQVKYLLELLKQKLKSLEK